MGDRLFYSRVQSVISSDTDRFSELVRRSGLSPSKDFRRVDLSYTDLRGEDLRDFDFTGSSFHGALVAGALFNDTVKRQQLRDSEKTSRAVVAIIGTRLPQFEGRTTSMLGKDIVVPKQFTDAAHKVAGDQDRRRIETGVHLGDSTDLAGRRMAHPFKLHDRTISNSRSAVIVFTPEDDIDFDALSATRRRFSKIGKTPIIFLIPELMRDMGPRQAILKHRLSQIPEELVLDFSIGARLHADNSATWTARGDVIGARAVSYLKVIARAQVVMSQPLARENENYTRLKPWVFSGHLGKRKAYYSAIANDLQEMEDQVGAGTLTGGRRHLLIRRDLFDTAPADNLVRALTPLNGTCALSLFDRQKESDPDFWVTTGPSETPIWQLLIDG